MDTEALLVAAKNGDRAALEALCALFHPRLCRYVYALARSRETAEDVAQEALIAMLRALPKFRGRDARKFEGWLFRIARNHQPGAPPQAGAAARGLRPARRRAHAAGGAGGAAEARARAARAGQAGRGNAGDGDPAL